MSRMKYIERWALMRASRPENLSEHSLEVAMIAHALCMIANVRYGKNLNGERAALIALYHDATEIITGDMPTPVKYGSDRLHFVQSGRSGSTGPPAGTAAGRPAACIPGDPDAGSGRDKRQRPELHAAARQGGG